MTMINNCRLVQWSFKWNTYQLLPFITKKKYYNQYIGNKQRKGRRLSFFFIYVYEWRLRKWRESYYLDTINCQVGRLVWNKLRSKLQCKPYLLNMKAIIHLFIDMINNWKTPFLLLLSLLFNHNKKLCYNNPLRNLPNQ